MSETVTETGNRGRRARKPEAVTEEEAPALTVEELPLEGRRRTPQQQCRRPRCKNPVVYRTDGIAAEAVSYCRTHLPANVTEQEVEQYLAGQPA